MTNGSSGSAAADCNVDSSVAAPVRIALVGVGKIAHAQHLPLLLHSASYKLAAVVSRHSQVDGVENFTDMDALLGARRRLGLNAVSLCTPPGGRHALARAALDADLHVMLEKPPAATVAEVVDLESRARARGRTLFTTWHSREAAGVEAARQWLAERAVRSVRVDWKEDVRAWHPGQQWIFEPGGLGVFDPGINALSILTRILPHRLTLQRSLLSIPANQNAPIAAELEFRHDDVAPVNAVFDFRQTGAQHWDIEVQTDEGTLLLSEGGRRLRIGPVEQVNGADCEYLALYAQFLRLIAARRSDVDVIPLQHVADAFMIAHQVRTDPFEY